jgi:transposase
MTDVMDYFTLTGKQRSMLHQLIDHSRDVRLVRRAYALLWLDDGESACGIAARLNVSRQTIYNWASRVLDRSGLSLTKRLADADRSGRPCTASGIIDPLIEAVIETDPRQLGYRSTIWTAPLLAEHLHEEHAVTVCINSVRLAIARLRIRWKRPRHCLALRPWTWRQAKGG